MFCKTLQEKINNAFNFFKWKICWTSKSVISRKCATHIFKTKTRVTLACQNKSTIQMLTYKWKEKNEAERTCEKSEFVQTITSLSMMSGTANISFKANEVLHTSAGMTAAWFLTRNVIMVVSVRCLSRHYVVVNLHVTSCQNLSRRKLGNRVVCPDENLLPATKKCRRADNNLQEWTKWQTWKCKRTFFLVYLFLRHTWWLNYKMYKYKNNYYLLLVSLSLQGEDNIIKII